MMSSFIFKLLTVCFLSLQINHAQQIHSTKSELIKIGLLIDKKESTSAKNAAEMAIELANSHQNSSEIRFKVLVSSMEGPWGTGSKEAVNMVFDEDVWAILGSHDSRNAHLVQQVISKTGVVLLSAWATDPTLSQAFIPWFFSCVSNDNQQAKAVIEEILKNKKLEKIAVASDQLYDSKLTVRNLMKVMQSMRLEKPKEFFYNGSADYFKRVCDSMIEDQTDAIIIVGSPSFSCDFIRKLRNNGMNQPIFATLSMLGEGKDELDIKQLLKYQHVTVATSGNWLQPVESSFQKKYYKKYGKTPDASAAYAFDGMNLLIQAIKKADFERSNLQKTMEETGFEGVTGFIHFDQNGNRKEPVGLIEIKNGNLKPIEN